MNLHSGCFLTFQPAFAADPEYSYDEIADALGLKRNTVAVKIHRIKDKLSKQM